MKQNTRSWCLVYVVLGHSTVIVVYIRTVMMPGWRSSCGDYIPINKIPLQYTTRRFRQHCDESLKLDRGSRFAIRGDQSIFVPALEININISVKRH